MFSIGALEQKTEIVEFEESNLDIELPIYGITWSPNPDEMPDCDFYLQHNTNVQLLADYLLFCKSGIFCVESTQRGNPHYHGWYQVDDTKELARVAVCKTMARFGMLKITQLKHVKVFNWKERGNALYYYKKDLCDAMLTMDPNPITKDSRSTVNWDIMDMVGFFSKDNKSLTTIKDKISDRKFYRDFYSDTIEELNIKNLRLE